MESILTKKQRNKQNKDKIPDILMNSDSQEQDPRKIQNLLQRFSIEGLKTKTKLSQRPIRWKENNFKSQWELKLDTIKLIKVRENMGDQVVICFTFASDWLKEWREIFGPITERSKAKLKYSRI